MNEPNEQDSSNDVMALLKRMQQQLAFLEKKMDTLIQQTQQRPQERPRNFGRPFRPFDRPRGDRPQGNRPQGDRPYGSRPQGFRPQGEGNYAPKKKFFGGHGRHRDK